MVFSFKCCGCWTVEIDYKRSYLAQESRRQLVSLAISLAFFISGHGYASSILKMQSVHMPRCLKILNFT